MPDLSDIPPMQAAIIQQLPVLHRTTALKLYMQGVRDGRREQRDATLRALGVTDLIENTADTLRAEMQK